MTACLHELWTELWASSGPGARAPLSGAAVQQHGVSRVCATETQKRVITYLDGVPQSACGSIVASKPLV